MTKKLPAHEKVVRKPITRACTFCHSKHLQCDASRPCKNCVKRGVADGCEDVVRKRSKYIKKGSASAARSVSEGADPNTSTVSTRDSSETPGAPLSSTLGTPHPAIALSAAQSTSSAVPITSTEHQNRMFPDLTDSFTPPAQPLSRQQLQQSQQRSSAGHHQSRLMSNVDSPDVFSSLFVNQEYAQLTDLLDADSAKSPSQSSAIYNTEFQTSFQSDNNTRPYISLSDNSTNTANTVPNLMLSAHAPDYTSPLILRHLIKVPEDVYTSNLQPYNYPKAYHALLDYLRGRFNKEQLMQIAETMAAYRPSFIAATRSLVEMDLLFAERSFQRSLLEYESMSSLSSSPTIMWRRTGEIVAVSTEFSSLTSHTKTEILSKRTFIIELMNDASALDYFRLFSSVAFGDLNGVIITECTLMSPNNEPIRCASTWTVKRDVFDIPMLIVGQFLPILQVK